MTSSTHGGRRPHAGRPPRADQAATVDVRLRLTPSDAATLDAARLPGESRQDAVRRMIAGGGR